MVQLQDVGGGFLTKVEDDPTPKLGGDLATGGFGLSIGDNDFNIKFNSASTKALNITNLGAGFVQFLVAGSIGTTDGKNISSSGSLAATTSLSVGTTSVLKGNLTIGGGTATDFTLKFNASANDGIITWDEDPGQFLFDHAINVTGNIIVSGTVDGVDIANRAFPTLSDVTISGVATDDILQWNGTAWVNKTIDDATIVRFTGTVPVDNSIARYHQATGKLVQKTGVIIDDSDFVTGMAKLTVDDVVIDAQLIEARLSSQDITVRGGLDAGKVVTIGRDGDTVLGGATLRVVYPQTDEKIDFGRIANRINEVHAVSFIPKSRVAWTLTGTPALDRTKAWSDGSVTNAEFCSLISDLQNAGVL